MITEQITEWLAMEDGLQRTRTIEEKFAIGSDIGLRRDENQDRVALLHVGSASRMKAFWCLALCDGMGGMTNGGQAASISLAAFFEELIRARRIEPDQRLENAASAANRAVSNLLSKGGSTLSAVLFERGEVFTLNIGDSRIYARSRESELLVRLTVDDTMEEAYKSSGKGLLQHIGMGDGLVPHIEKLKPTDFETFVITSDGAHLIGEKMLSSLQIHASNSEEFCRRVIEVARWVGGPDNASVATFQPPKHSVSNAEESTTDISIWSIAGRLKIVWPDFQRSTDGSPEKQHPKSGSASKKTAEAGEQNDEGDQKKNTEQKKKRRSTQKKEDDQIELGFSDEDDD